MQIHGSLQFAAVLSIEGVRRFVGHSDSQRYYPERGLTDSWVTAIRGGPEKTPCKASTRFSLIRGGSFQVLLRRFVGR